MRAWAFTGAPPSGDWIVGNVKKKTSTPKWPARSVAENGFTNLLHFFVAKKNN
jgi:hypothetical protein